PNILTLDQNSKGISKGVRNFIIPNPFCLQTEAAEEAAFFFLSDKVVHVITIFTKF
ncbi:UNVERIFIED_ORG: hypothetical protein ABIC97_003734, partial [Peribacillus simplex]